MPLFLTDRSVWAKGAASFLKAWGSAPGFWSTPKYPALKARFMGATIPRSHASKICAAITRHVLFFPIGRNQLAIPDLRAIIRRCRESLNRFRFALNARVRLEL